MIDRMHDNSDDDLAYRSNVYRPIFEQMNRVANHIEPIPVELPDWLSVPEPPPPKQSPEMKALVLRQCEMVFPRVLEMVYGGYTLASALRELPIEIDHGIFYRWLKKDPKNHELYKEAKEIRTEAWAGKIIEHATGVDSSGNTTMEDTQRSKLIVDTYKWLMGADNRKQYGDTKTIDVTGGISITAALSAAHQRVIGAIDADFEEVTATSEPRLLTEGDED